MLIEEWQDCGLKGRKEGGATDSVCCGRAELRNFTVVLCGLQSIKSGTGKTCSQFTVRSIIFSPIVLRM